MFLVIFQVFLVIFLYSVIQKRGARGFSMGALLVGRERDQEAD